MMKTNLNIKVDADIRDRAKKLYAQMGLDMTTAVNLFLIASLREQKIPFEICAVSKPNEEEA
ncbi:MAG TPA: type II toxin-antitoxin system antitoxin, RelB/DinJ family, partial [Clostridiales bacterium]|nr:type II toxin-antitoxin system antitoxin, RelB/DinJ family [Clostridiales bacterium]